MGNEMVILGSSLAAAQYAGPIMSGIALGAGFFLLGLVVLVVWRSFLRICPPNAALVRTGIGNQTVIVGGRLTFIPLFSKVIELPVGLLEVPVTVRNAYSKGGIAMNIEAIANVKVSTARERIGNAIEKFAENDQMIPRVAKETLEGHLRTVIAQLTPEQVNEDRLAFADQLSRESEDDLRGLGLDLDTLKILHVSDEVGYLDATGRKAIANIVRSSEIAESNARRNAEQAEAEAEGRASVAVANAQAQIVTLENDLRRVEAELGATVKAEEARTMAAAREARATAEQRLQQVRAALATIQLQVDQVLPAEAKRQSDELLAQGEAAIIRERGRAVAEALDLLHDAWQKAGPSATQIALIEELEPILKSATEGVKKIQIGSVSIIDSGDGKTLSNYLGAYPEMLKKVLDAVNQTVGLDISGSIAGRTALAQIEEKA
jgi:flotillin